MSRMNCHRRGGVLRALALLALAGVLAACSKPPEQTAVVAVAASAPSAPTDGVGIDWLHAANDTEVDAAFGRARQQGKPVFVYWGAAWCPPCNQLKATLFNRADFIERSRAFVPVYVDGDSAGAQKLGTRFKVRGYPTMVLFDPKGAEITRLPGEVDPQLYTEVLTLGMAARRFFNDSSASAMESWRTSWPSSPSTPVSQRKRILAALSASATSTAMASEFTR